MQVSQSTAEVLEQWFDDVRYDYSGRGMFGNECIAIVTDEGCFSIATSLQEISDEYEDDDEVSEMIESMLGREPRQDSMGLSTVYYWPAVEVAE